MSISSVIWILTHLYSLLFLAKLADLGINVVMLLVGYLEKPSHMVDSGYLCYVILAVLLLKSDLFEKVRNADLNAMAESDRLYLGKSLHKVREHAHGVSVVKEPRIGAYLLHIVGKRLHNGNGTERTHDAAYTESVRNRLAKAVLLGYLKVYNR